MEESLRHHVLVQMRRGCLPLLAGVLFAGAVQAQRPPLPKGAETAPDTVRPLIGAWNLEQVGAPRQCTITLGAEQSGPGRQLRFPATCRRALPIIGQIVSWSVAEGGGLRLNDEAGKAVITLTKSSAGLNGKGTDGQDYLLDPKDHPRSARPVPPSAAERAATAAARPTVVNLAAAPATDAVPGRYVTMRQQNREGCRLMLEAGAANAPSGAPARFDGRCDDTGLTIFDPVGWRYAAGRLSLVARKGHSVDLVFENGQWRKDPAVGAPLMLRKLAP